MFMVIARTSWWIVFGFMVQGCMGPSRPWPHNNHSTVLSPAGQLDFGWKLSGERSIAPLQVFSDATQTWLQWLPQQALPIIVTPDADGERVLPYTRQDPYTIIAGHWPRLIFRMGHHQAQARRVRLSQPASQTSAQQAPANFAAQAAASGLTSATGAKPVNEVKSLTPNTVVYTVTPEDQHLRQTLMRWTQLSGWHFQAEHWGVDVDIPVSGAAKFSDDFISSVQALVEATELSERPLQPCFYANQVLRVIAISESCDRTSTPAVAGAPV
jgi:hypothetical protein